MIGVDPGGRSTGVVARATLRAAGPLYAAVVTRDLERPFRAYLLEVLETIAVARARDRGDHSGAVAVEDVVAPSGFAGGQRAPIALDGLIGTAKVYGAVLTAHPTALEIPPGGHGSQLLASYPRALVGPREQRGTGYRRHARSAWDIAGAGLLHHP